MDEWVYGGLRQEYPDGSPRPGQMLRGKSLCTVHQFYGKAFWTISKRSHLNLEVNTTGNVPLKHWFSSWGPWTPGGSLDPRLRTPALKELCFKQLEITITMDECERSTVFPLKGVLNVTTGQNRESQSSASKKTLEEFNPISWLAMIYKH